MTPLEMIVAKRDGASHRPADLRRFVGALSAGEVPDYQVAAWLMAAYLRGLDPTETAALTEAMADSGRRLDLSGLGRGVVDKHSTGGVGDKTSLVVGPLAAAMGLTMAKMSGRGLGHTGGTLDKLESIPGLRVDLAPEAFIDQARRIGLVIAGQSVDLAPADKLLYALRDVTGTVPSIPLIAASIMSKKLAAGAPAIVLDVKVGVGAFMRRLEDAEQLAEAMIGIGRRSGRRMGACLSRMDGPLGRSIGNTLELREAIETLHGQGPADLHELSLTLVGLLLVLADQSARPEHLRDAMEAALRDGSALLRLRRMVEAQGGDPRFIDEPDRLPQAAVVHSLPAARGGWVAGLDALGLAETAVALGAGRRTKEDSVDHAVGLRLLVKPGDRIEQGRPWIEIHASSEADLAAVTDQVQATLAISASPGPPPPDVVIRHWVDTGAAL